MRTQILAYVDWDLKICTHHRMFCVGGENISIIKTCLPIQIESEEMNCGWTKLNLKNR